MNNVNSESVQRWRAPLERRRAIDPKLAQLPIDMLLRWIAKESGGNFRVVSSLGERGLFQMAASTAAGMGLSDAEFKRLSEDGQHSFDVGIREVHLMIDRATQFLKRAGQPYPASWPGFTAMVKLYHALPKAVEVATVGFAGKHGRPPKDWEEAKAWTLAQAATRPSPFDYTRRGGKNYSKGVPRYFANAEYTSGYPGGTVEIAPPAVAVPATPTTDPLVAAGLASMVDDDDLQAAIRVIIEQRPIPRDELLAKTLELVRATEAL